MKKRIAIIIPPSAGGGVFQHGIAIAQALTERCPDFNYTIFYFSPDKVDSLFPEENLVEVKSKSAKLPRRSLHFFGGLVFGIKPFLMKDLENRLREEKVDLALLPAPFTYDFPVSLPYVVFVPDLMYRYFSNLPDYSLLRRTKRDIVYRANARNARLCIADSEQGKNDLHKFLNIPKEKIRIIPHPPAAVWKYKDMAAEEVEKLLVGYKLPPDFLFYPAAFWHQKNHLNLLRSLANIKKKYGEEVPLVLSGSGGFPELETKIKKLAVELNLQKVIFLGFVSDKELVALYKKCRALVFPTLIGPTSIPPLEAMIFGTPIFCSYIFEMPKQIGEAGVFFNPLCVEDMTEKIYGAWNDEALLNNMAAAGRLAAKEMTKENYALKWGKVIKECL